MKVPGAKSIGRVSVAYLIVKALPSKGQMMVKVNSK